MACFIVIHADNKDEKLQIISNFDDKLKYAVVPDLKDYVAKLYKVRIVEEEETVQNEQMIALNKEFNDMTMDSSMEEDITNDTAALSIDDALVPSSSDQQSMRNDMDDTNVTSSLQTLDISSTSKEVNNNDDDVVIIFDSNQQAMRNDKEQPLKTPSTSTRRRSERSAKRRRDDEDLYLEYCSVKKKVTDLKREEDKGVECQECHKMLTAKYRQYCHAKTHAIGHGFLRYKCPEKECNYKGGPSHNLIHHLRQKHAIHSLSAAKLELTKEQEEELHYYIKKCFPLLEIPEEEAIKYKKCKDSDTHIDSMLYKCNQPNCYYQTKYYKEMTRHGRSEHGIREMSKEIELTHLKERLMILRKKCFPKEHEDNDD